MIVLLSPSKAMDFSGEHPPVETTQPLFLREAQPLVEKLRPLGAADLRSLFGVSDKVAALNQERYRNWSLQDHEAEARPALYAYQGAVYKGLGAEEFSPEDRRYAQDHLRIISGLYGLLRPGDAILPYRLDMGTRLQNPAGGNLYAYWRDRLTQEIARELRDGGGDEGSGMIVNLASKEYADAVDFSRLPGRVLTCEFRDWKGGRYKQIQYYVKRARGLMARYILQHRIRDAEALKDFNLEGYFFSEDGSEGDRLLFLRDHVDTT